MDVNGFSCLASFLYLNAGLVQYLVSSRKIACSRLVILGLLLIALCLHGYCLYRWIDTPWGQNLAPSVLFSLCCWVIALLIFLLAALIKPLQKLSLFILPLSALSILTVFLFPGTFFIQTRHHIPTLIHILISIGATGLFGMAALQAGLMHVQNQCLRPYPHPEHLQILPPLQTMESLLFRVIQIGLGLLTGSILTAMIGMDKTVLSAHPYKIALSLIAWCWFAGLVYGRYRSGLRGHTAVRWTLCGVLLLLGGYFLSKIFQTT